MGHRARQTQTALVVTIRALAARVARLERELGIRPGARRVSAAAAARLLGVDARSVRRLVEGGQLEGAVLALPGRERRRWVVSLSSVERLLAEADSGTGPTAATAANEEPEASPQTARRSKRG